MVKKAAEQGLPALKDLFGKLSKEDCEQAIGMLEKVGVPKSVVDMIKPVVNLKNLFG